MSHERPSRTDGSAWRMVDGEMIVVSATTASILSLNGTGAFVWERLDGSASVTEIAQALSEEFEVEPAAAAEDLTAFLGELEDEGLVFFESEAPGA